jgi:hypothetical protein
MTIRSSVPNHARTLVEDEIPAERETQVGWARGDTSAGRRFLLILRKRGDSNPRWLITTLAFKLNGTQRCAHLRPQSVLTNVNRRVERTAVDLQAGTLDTCPAIRPASTTMRSPLV